MKTSLPRNYTLDQLLHADPVGTLYEKIEEAGKLYDLAHFDDAMRSKATGDKWRSSNEEKNPELRDRLAKLDITTPEGFRASVELHGISYADMKHWKKFREDRLTSIVSVFDETALIRSWRVLKSRAKITDVGEKNFPTELERPMLVLYSADWCGPCVLIRPTFARLVPFFDNADVRYCHDDEYRRNCGIAFIPQFVAYFPNGSSVFSHVPRTAREIWNTMNKLVVLGQSFSGEGELVCTEESCSIVPTNKS